MARTEIQKIVEISIHCTANLLINSFSVEEVGRRRGTVCLF